MKKQALALGPQGVPRPEPAEKPVLVKAEKQWNHEEEVFRLGHQEKHEHPNEKIQRLLPGMDLKRWMY